MKPQAVSGLVWMLQALLRPFILTVLLEGILALVLFRSREAVYASFLCNMLTNPALNLILQITVSLFGIRTYLPTLVVLEVLVLFVEGGIYHFLCRWEWKKALAVSLLLNGASLLTGFYILV